MPDVLSKLSVPAPTDPSHAVRKADLDAGLSGKQPSLTARAANTLMVAPTVAGGQPGGKAMSDFLASPAAQANDFVLLAPRSKGGVPTLFPLSSLIVTGSQQLPRILRFMLPVTARQGNHPLHNSIDQRLKIQFDKPLPPGCELQLYRESKRSGSKGSGRGRVGTKRAFRPIGRHDPTWPHYTFPTQATYGGHIYELPFSLRAIYRPRQFRGGRQPFNPNNPYIGQYPPLTHPNRVRFRMGLYHPQLGLGVPSMDILEIMYWYSGKAMSGGRDLVARIV